MFLIQTFTRSQARRRGSQASRRPRWFRLVLASVLNVGYGDYIRGPRWLVEMLAPTTVAFAVPIYRRRSLILRHWILLTIGIVRRQRDLHGLLLVPVGLANVLAAPLLAPILACLH